MAKEPGSILASDYVKIAFLRTATKEQYELARETLQDKINFGTTKGLVDYDQARVVAEAEAQAMMSSAGFIAESLSPQSDARIDRPAEAGDRLRA